MKAVAEATGEPGHIRMRFAASQRAASNELEHHVNAFRESVGEALRALVD